MQPTEEIQIHRYRNIVNDKILTLHDHLAFDPKSSKIVFVMIEWDADTRKATQVVHHAVNSDDIKLVCHDLLAGVFSRHESSHGHNKIMHNGPDEITSTVMVFSKEAKYRQPFVLQIDNGLGEEYGGGEIRMVKATDSLTIQMPEWEARKMALILLDYIRQWEMINFRKRQDERCIVLDTKEVSS